MNPITMKLVVDDLILQALREDITFEDVTLVHKQQLTQNKRTPANGFLN